MNELKWCIDYLKEYNHISRELPIDWSTFRALLNITMPLNLLSPSRKKTSHDEIFAVSIDPATLHMAES